MIVLFQIKKDMNYFDIINPFVKKPANTKLVKKHNEVGQVDIASRTTTKHLILNNDGHKKNLESINDAANEFSQLIHNFSQSDKKTLSDEQKNEMKLAFDNILKTITYEEHKKIHVAWKISEDALPEVEGYKIERESAELNVDKKNIHQAAVSKFGNLKDFTNFIGRNNMDTLPKHIQLFCKSMISSMTQGKEITVTNQELVDFIDELTDPAKQTGSMKYDMFKNEYTYVP